MKYVPLHCHSHYSLLDGLSKPYQMAERCLEIDSKSIALTDHGVINGSIQFYQTMIKNNIKPILGCELYISKQNADIRNGDNKVCLHIPILAKNNQGWKQLIQIISKSNDPEYFYYRPRLSLRQLAQYLDGNIIGFSGHLGSHMATYLQAEDIRYACKKAEWIQELFGKGNFYLEVQLMDHVANPEQRIIAEQIREVSKRTGIPCIATPDAHYAFQNQASDQRVLLATNMHKTLKQLKDEAFFSFFKSDQYHIPSHEEMLSYGHTEEELSNTLEIDSKIENYDNILKKPLLGDFECPDNLTPDEYIFNLCQKGMNDKVSKDKMPLYNDRINKELKVLQEAGLSSYFLMIADIVKYVKNQKWLIGPGRGSASGSLVSYLMDITQIDPIPYGLMFERFYNAGRNTKNRISMPDIDIDVPTQHRDKVIEYIKHKYGNDKVGQMITYQTMKGRAALKDVMRAYGDVSFSEMNEMTRNIPQESKIADELQTMKEKRGKSSIIMWALENSDGLKEWCYVEDNVLKGPMANRFSQAIRLEETKSAVSKHPAGVIIAPTILSELCPMIYDTKSKQQIIGFEMEDAESVGLIKYDVLGLALLDKLSRISETLASGAGLNG